MPDNNGEIIIYQSEDGSAKIDVRIQYDTVWLSQQQMAELFNTSRTNVVDHIKNIYEEGELSREATCRKFRQVQIEGSREVSREIPFYNLDMIISLGYRVKSAINKPKTKPIWSIKSTFKRTYLLWRKSISRQLRVLAV